MLVGAFGVEANLGRNDCVLVGAQGLGSENGLVVGGKGVANYYGRCEGIGIGGRNMQVVRACVGPDFEGIVAEFIGGRGGAGESGFGDGHDADFFDGDVSGGVCCAGLKGDISLDGESGARVGKGAFEVGIAGKNFVVPDKSRDRGFIGEK